MAQPDISIALLNVAKDFPFVQVQTPPPNSIISGTSQVPLSQMCSHWSVGVDACVGPSRVRLCCTCSNPCPGAGQVDRWPPAPTKEALSNPAHCGGGFLPDLEDAEAETRSPRSARGAAFRTSCLVGRGGGTSSSSEEQKQVAVASQPVPFPGCPRQLAEAGRRRGSEGRNLLPERTGRLHSCGETWSHHPTPLLQTAHPASPLHRACASGSVHCQRR